MLVFGITGGSGSGKTTVCRTFKSLGAEIIDTDIIAREVTANGSKCLDELAAHFGSEILQPDGSLNRRRLAQLAFADAKKTELLSMITHKYIHERVTRRLSDTASAIAVIDGAVLIGSPIEKECAFIVSVISDRETRLARIISRDGISRADAEKRLAAQPNDAFYREHSRYTLINNGSEGELIAKAEQLWRKIKEVEI